MFVTDLYYRLELKKTEYLTFPECFNFSRILLMLILVRESFNMWFMKIVNILFFLHTDERSFWWSVSFAKQGNIVLHKILKKSVINVDFLLILDDSNSLLMTLRNYDPLFVQNENEYCTMYGKLIMVNMLLLKPLSLVYNNCEHVSKAVLSVSFVNILKMKIASRF